MRGKLSLVLATALLLCLPLMPLAEGFMVGPNAVETSPAPTVSPFVPIDKKGPAPFEAWPTLDGEGFLQDEGAEFIHIDAEAGLWVYLSARLRVVITRYAGVWQKKEVVWYLSDIRYREGLAFKAFSADPNNPKRAQAPPQDIARKNKLVYAQNGDLFSWRLYNKQLPGLIIRDGKVLTTKTYTSAKAAVPPLDELALYPDGSLAVHTPGQMNPQDYLDSGATDVLAFGPILFQDFMKDQRLDRSFTHREPRSAIGMVKNGHVVGILVEGRNQRSAGVGLQFVADRLLEAGCHTAYTLDGGQTAAMMFLGENLMSPGIYNGFQKARKQQDVIGIGQTDVRYADQIKQTSP